MLVGVTWRKRHQLGVSHIYGWRLHVLPSLKAGEGWMSCPFLGRWFNSYRKTIRSRLNRVRLLKTALCIAGAWVTSAEVCRSRLQNIFPISFLMHSSLVPYRDTHILLVMLFSRLHTGQDPQQPKCFTWLYCLSADVLKYFFSSHLLSGPYIYCRNVWVCITSVMVDVIAYLIYYMVLQLQCWLLHFSYRVLQYLSSAVGS